MTTEEHALRQGLIQLQLALDDHKIKQLMDYLALMIKWNKAYNLSAIRDPLQMVQRHLLDSLAIAPYLKGSRFADVGTGAGLPGIPLAIVYPEHFFSLVDSAGKKTRFLTQVVQSLSLSNVEVQNLRVETWHPSPLFDCVISRAFASLKDMTHWCEHLLTLQGFFLAMKGQYPHDELRDIEKNYIVCESQTLDIPGVDAQRCLVIIQSRQVHQTALTHPAVQP